MGWDNLQSIYHKWFPYIIWQDVTFSFIFFFYFSFSNLFAVSNRFLISSLSGICCSCILTEV